MTKIIEVRLTKSTVDNLGNEIHVMNVVNKKMKAAGIPVVGWSCVKGVEHGRLEITLSDEEYVYKLAPRSGQGQEVRPAQ